ESTTTGELFSGLLSLDAEQGGGLCAEALQLLILRAVLLHPGGRPVVQAAGLVLLALPPAGHRQKEPLRGVPALGPRHRFLQGRARAAPIAGAIQGDAERVPARAHLRDPRDGLAGQLDRLLRVALLLVRARRQEAGQVGPGARAVREELQDGAV